MERIYAIVHATKKLVYVGRTYRSLNQRWIEHLEGAADLSNPKLLYEAMRFEPDAFEILECECSSTAIEEHWVQVFQDEGYTLLNEKGANRYQPRRRNKDLERAWREANAQAYGRLGPQDYNAPWK